MHRPDIRAQLVEVGRRRLAFDAYDAVIDINQAVAVDAQALARQSDPAQIRQAINRRDVDVKYGVGRQALRERHLDDGPRHLRRYLVIRWRVGIGIGQGEGHGGNAADSRLQRGADCAAVGQVLPHILAAIDAGNDNIRFAVDQAQQGERDAIGRRTLDDERRDAVADRATRILDVLVQGDLMPAGALIGGRGADPYLAQAPHGFRQRYDARRVVAVIVGHDN